MYTCIYVYVYICISVCMYICLYVYMYVCMVFANIWRFKAPSKSKVVPYDSRMNSTLLRHEIIGMW